jgi:hypothetical protein
MKSMRKLDDVCNELTKIALSPIKRKQVWDAIERRIDSEGATDTLQDMPITQPRSHRSTWGQFAAAIAAVAVLCVCIPSLVHHQFWVSTKTTAVGSDNHHEDNASSGSVHSITIDDIKQYYAKNHRKIVAMTSYPAYHAVIVESNLDPTVANDFDWWDMNTGKVAFLAGRPFYMSIHHVVSANEVVFLATGGNSESPFVDFPYYIDAKRRSANSPFVDTNRQAAYFPIKKSITFGDGKVEVLSQLSVTSDGVTMGFSPIKGQETNFVADSTGVPKTTISIIPGTNELIITLKNTHLNVGQTRLHGMRNAFVQSIAVQSIGKDVQVVLHLSNQTKFYTGSVDRQYVMPTTTLRFANEDPTKLGDNGIATSKQMN